MSSSVYVAGVGMIPFRKPGASAPLHRDGRGGHAAGAGRCRHRLRPDAAGLCRLRLRRLDLRPDGAVRGRHDRHPGRQRQQQLLDRFDRAVPGAPGGRRAARSIARWRSASSRCSRARSASPWNDRRSAARARSTPPPTSCVDAAERPAALRMFGGAGREHMQKYGTKLETFATIRAKASRHAANNPLALFRKVVTTEDVMNDAGALARRDDAPDGLPADLRRRRGDRRLARRSPRSTACAPTCTSLAQAMTTDTARHLRPPST